LILCILPILRSREYGGYTKTGSRGTACPGTYSMHLAQLKGEILMRRPPLSGSMSLPGGPGSPAMHEDRRRSHHVKPSFAREDGEYVNGGGSGRRGGSRRAAEMGDTLGLTHCSVSTMGADRPTIEGPGSEATGCTRTWRTGPRSAVAS